MNHYKLSKDQIAASGYTDLFVVKASDLSAITTDDLLCNIALDTLQLGDIVSNDTMIEIKQLFAPVPSANAVVTASVGQTGSSYVDMLAASNIVNSTAIPIKTSYVAGEAIASVAIATANTVIYCQVDITDTDGDLATMTAGEFRIWMNINRESERPVLGDA